MSYNPKNFVSAEPLFAEIREELSSYFNTGAVDDLMFPKYLNDVLKTLRKSALPVRQTVIKIQNNQGTLPDDFDSVKEIWACRNVTFSIQNPSSHYYVRDIRLDDVTPSCGCQEEAACDACDPCNKQYNVIHKQTGVTEFSYSFSHPLQPGNLQARNKCSSESLNLCISSPDTFTLDGCNIYTNIQDSVLHLMYYANGMDENDEQLIIDDFWVIDYASKYIKMKIFQKLYNSATDETFNQSRIKFQEAEQAMLDARITAFIELKKESKQKMNRRMTRTENKYNRYYTMLGFRR